jgi:hypothetical protein
VESAGASFGWVPTKLESRSPIRYPASIMRVRHHFWLLAGLLSLAAAVASGMLTGGLAVWIDTWRRWQEPTREVGVVLGPLLVIYALSFVLLLACLDFGSGTVPKGDLEHLIGLKAGGGFPHRSRRGGKVRAAFMPGAAIAAHATGTGAMEFLTTDDALEHLLRLKHRGA